MDDEKKPLGFNSAKKSAEKILDNNERLKALLKKAKNKAKDNNDKLKGVWKDFQTLLRFLKAWKKKEYREIPWRTVLYAAAAILYFVNPFDIVPDFIPLTGLLDDITIISFVLNAIHSDIVAFEEWENLNKKV